MFNVGDIVAHHAKPSRCGLVIGITRDQRFADYQCRYLIEWFDGVGNSDAHGYGSIVLTKVC